MRIFELNTFCGEKSTGRITTEIAKLVKADGGECRVGYGAGTPPKDAEEFAFRIGTPVERKLHGAIRKLLDAEGYGSALGTHQLIKELERFQPDLIHLHNLHGCYLELGTLFHWLAKAKLPVVWTLHDCWPFTGHCAYFDHIGCDRWQSGCNDCPQQRSYPVCYGLDGSKRNYARKKRLFTSVDNITFVAPCEWMKQPLSQSFFKDYDVRVIPNGVDQTVFHPTESDLRERYGLQGKTVLLSVASEWDDRKGLQYLIWANGHFGEDHVFVVIGLSPEQKAALPKDMLGFCHTSNVEELAAWYTTADVLVNPTLEDNMPMVNLEALSCGTPIVAFQTGGCPEAVGEDCGETVEKDNTPALCRAIQRVAPNSASYRSACLKRAERFDSRRTFQAYLDLYKELIRS